MRDVIVCLILMSTFPACFRRPFVGMVVFSWLGYMRVQDLTWGFARGLRWSYYVAIITMAGYVINGGRVFFVADIRSFVMLLLFGLVVIGYFVSEPTEGASTYQLAKQFNRLLEFGKIIAIALFTPVVVKTREHLRILCWVVALSFGFFGVKNGIWGLMNFGGTIKQGPGGMLADNNDFALALTVGVPLLFCIGMSEKRELLRRAFFLTVPMTMLTIMLTHSRGGFLSLTGALGVLIWRSRNRMAGIVVGLMIAVSGIILAPAGYKERISSISDYENDGSARARFRSWAVAVRMADDNPWFGVGLGKFRQHYLDYEPDPTPQERDGTAIYVAHNSYLQIWAECGSLAFACYISLIVISFITIWRVRARAKRLYYTSWILYYANAFEAGLVGFMIGSTFLNRAHFDLFYHFISIIMAFGLIAHRDMSSGIDDEPQAVKQGRGRIHAVREVGFGRPVNRRGFRNTPLLPRGA